MGLPVSGRHAMRQRDAIVTGRQYCMLPLNGQGGGYRKWQILAQPHEFWQPEKGSSCGSGAAGDAGEQPADGIQPFEHPSNIRQHGFQLNR